MYCSSVVGFSSCISPNCCSIGALYGLIIGTYDVTELGTLEVSTEVTTDGNLEGLFLRGWLVSIYGRDIGTNVGNELGLSDWKVLGRILGDIVGLYLDD